jgi:hypothetical protein
VKAVETPFSPVYTSSPVKGEEDTRRFQLV